LVVKTSLQEKSNMTRGVLRFGLAALGIALLVGCGGSGGTFATTGTVTYKGQPVKNVSVTFTPTQGQIAHGTTNDSGKFKLTTSKPGDGALPGTYKVTLSLGPDAPVPPMPGTPEAANYKPEPPPFPVKYANPQTSDLNMTVEKGKANDFDLKLTD
jgi:hypothetical protein